MQIPFDPIAFFCVLLISGLIGYVTIWHGWVLSRHIFFKRKTDCRLIVFVFDRGILSDCSDITCRLIDNIQCHQTVWSDVRAVLAKKIADLPVSLTGADHAFQRFPQSYVHNAPYAQFETWGPITRVTVKGWDLSQDAAISAALQYSTQPDLRYLNTEFPIWKMNLSGELVWSNDTYDQLYKRSNVTKPKSELFTVPVNLPEKGKFFSSIATSVSEQKCLFEIHHCNHGESVIFFGFDASALEESESNRRNIVQTLSKTFAQLSVAIAIFDQNKRLVLFNPALIDLFGFAPYFLMRKPNIQEFFDHMREHRMMPEPRQYTEWRQQIASLIASAEDGSYSERWHIAEGVIYSVTGMPHPDGAIELLFEDISREVGSARRFRAQAEKTQAVLDHLPEAHIVFKPSGDISGCNQAFREMWKVDPNSSFADFSYRDVFLVWTQAFSNPEILDRISAFQNANGPRMPWLELVTGPQGQRLIMDVIPLPDQETLIRFSLVLDMPETTMKKLTAT